MRSVLGLGLALLATIALASSSSALVIALSNDDGWDAPGIQAMKAALEGAGHTVTLAGPLDEQSGSSQCPLPVAELKHREHDQSLDYSAHPGSWKRSWLAI